MAKKIPTSLKRSIAKALITSDSDLTAAQVSERVNSDPDLPENYRKTPKQMAFVLNRISRDVAGIETIVVSKNGISHHGTERFRKQYRATYETLAEAEADIGVVKKPKKRLQAVTINIGEESVEYIQAWREKGMSAGKCVEMLIKADIEANGLPTDEDSE
jgi:hypothetical protein